MSGTGNALAVRDGYAPAVPSGALAIADGQVDWTPMQAAAFGQLGIADAPEGDKQVLLHVSQRTGLDPFARQLYMIGRKEKKSEKVNGQWVERWSVKWTIQTGIEGFRVIRGRAERHEGVRGILSEPVYYDGKGQAYPVWFFQQPPVAVKMTYTARDRNGVETPYTSILRFDEYRQTRKETRDGVEQQVLSGQWATKPTHMLEKCTEADVYRKAFPQDYSGVQLEDAMPEAIPGELEPEEQPQRQRVTAAQARERRPAAVATVIPADPSPAPAGPSAAPADPPQQGAGEDPTTSGASSSAPAPEHGSQTQTGAPSPSSPSGSGPAPEVIDHDTPGTATRGKGGQLTALWTVLFTKFGFTDAEKPQARAVCEHITGRALTGGTTGDLSYNEAKTVLDTLGHWQYGAEQEQISPRDYMTMMMIDQDPDAAAVAGE